MRLKLNLLLPAAALLAASLSSSSAFASAITGSFSLTSLDGTYIGGSAQSATGLDFGSSSGGVGNGFGVNGSAVVGNATGSFAAFNNSTASISDIILGAFANPYKSNPFISFAGSPLMVNFTNATYFLLPTSVVINGTASFSDGIAGDASTGTFALSTSSQGGAPSSAQFTFTGNVAAPAVAVTPEPSSLALLGTGLVGAASMALRRRRISA